MAVGPDLRSKESQATCMHDRGLVEHIGTLKSATQDGGHLCPPCPQGPSTDTLHKGYVGLLPDVLGDSSHVEEQLGHKWGQQPQDALSDPKGLSVHCHSLVPGAPEGGAS